MKSSVYNIFEDVNETNFPCFKHEFFQLDYEVDTISINHNWFNGYDLSFVRDLLLRDYNEVKEYIEDMKDLCDDFEGLCQWNLAASTGMNFCYFIIFMVWFMFANLVQLHHLARSNESINLISSQRAQNKIFNIESVRNIALKMKSVGAEANRGFMIDFRKMLEDATSLELCKLLGRAYGMIHEQCKVSYDMKQEGALMLLDFFESAGSRVCNPEDLASFINYACTKLFVTAVEIVR